MVMYDPLPTDQDEEERRRLAREAELAAQQAAPARISQMPLPGPGPVPDYSGWQPMDTLGRVVPIPSDPRAFSAYNPLWEGEAGRQASADRFVADLARYNATPRDERFFQPIQEVAPVTAIPPLVDPNAGPLPVLRTPEDSDRIAQDVMQRVVNMALDAVGQGPRRTADGQEYPRVEQVMSAEEERDLARRQRGSMAGAPSMADNDAIITNALSMGPAPAQTAPTEEGQTFPDYGTIRDQLNQEYRLVAVGPGQLMVYDPRSGRYDAFDPDQWLTAQGRANLPAARARSRGR